MDRPATEPEAGRTSAVQRAGVPEQVVPVDSPWMTPAQAAAYLGVALGTLRNWTSAKFVPFARRGRCVRYHRGVLDRWLSRGACPGRSTFADQLGVTQAAAPPAEQGPSASTTPASCDPPTVE
jgi:excisionase family DNA binding protein